MMNVKTSLRKTILILIIIFAITISGFFHYTVYAAADKTALETAYSQVQAINSTQANSPVGDPYYEETSFQAFTDAINGLGGLSGIQSVINDDLATQAEVDDLTENINNAINGLILDDTYYQTLANFSQAKAIDLSIYTSNSQILYNDELDNIETILNNPTAGNEAINNLNADIDAAANLLVLRGDKTELIAVKDEIETIYQSTGDDYIPSTFTNFKTAYDNIDTVIQADIGLTLQQLLDDIDALQSDVDIAKSRLDDVLDILIIKPDKSTLITEYNNALLIDEDLYTSSSYSTFENGLISINNVINDIEATDADVTQALTDLTDLYSVLVFKADVTDLEAEYNNAISKDLSEYTPNSIQEFEAELNRINNILISDDTDQATADQALDDLLNAYDLLIKQADCSKLSTLNELIIVAYYEERSIYTESSYQEFKTAIDNIGSYIYINSIINDDNIDQATVNSLSSELQDALDLLIPIYDNSSILVLYTECKNIDLTGYTEDSITNYNNELDRLFDIITGREFDAEAATQVANDLMNASDLLVLLPDMTELQELYDSTSIYREEDYSVSSYGAYVVAKDNALNVLQDKNADENMVENAITLLQNAIDELMPKQETIYIFEGDAININQYITLGQADILNYSIDDPNVLSIDNSGNVTGLKYGETNVHIALSNGYTETLTLHVKAKLSTSVIILTFTVPVVSIGLGATIVFVKKDTWILLGKYITMIFKRK